jgi:hypothetical protein
MLSGMRIKPFRACLLALLFAVSASLLLVAQAAQGPDTSNHLVIISLDGFTARALADPSVPLPTLRRLAAQGATATEGMRPVNPTVTWANHTSMITGVAPAKHGVIFNGLLIHEPGMPPRVEQWRDRNEMVHFPTLYDVAHGKGLTTAQVDWVAIWNAPTITWEFRELPDRRVRSRRSSSRPARSRKVMSRASTRRTSSFATTRGRPPASTSSRSTARTSSCSTS